MNDTDKTDAPLPEPAQANPENAGRVPSLEGELHYGGGARRGQADEDIERELQEAMGGLSAEDIFADTEARARQAAAAPREPGGKKKGKVLRVHGQDVFVDVPGGRSQGVLTLEQFPDGAPQPGDEVEFTIEGAEHGLLILSRKGATVHADWSSVAEGMIVEARVTETNKGGLSVDVNGIRGFMPISQIDLYRVEDAEQFVNQRLRCMVVEVNQPERNLVVSRRELLEKERIEQREKTWNELAEGQVREGIVRSVKDYGAFVDLGGVDGLLHVSEMSWNRHTKAEEVVQPGQTVRVVVLKIDHEKRKLGLGLKQLAPGPWDDVTTKYHAGSIVTGKVTRLAEFGAFVELEPAIEGLIHISELAPQRVHRARDIVQEGQEVQVKVLNVDPAQHRISLSLKEAAAKELEPEAAEEEEDYTPPPPKPRTTPLRGGLGDRR